MFEAAGLLASSRPQLIPNIKLKFNRHLEDKIDKFNRIIGSIKEQSLILPRTCLLTNV